MATELAAPSGAGSAEDVRSSFVFQEALRGLLQQQAAVESLHARAATLIFAARSRARFSVPAHSQTASGLGTGPLLGCSLRSAPWR